MKNIKKTKLWWMFIVLSVILLTLGVFFLPVWANENVFFADWGEKTVLACIGAIIIVYLFTFLFQKLKVKGKGAIKVLAIIEFILLFVTAVACLLMTFDISLGIPTEKNACTILGIAFYLRGTIEILRAYYYRSSSQEKYPLWWLAVALSFVTIGCWMFFRPFFSNITVQWVISVLVICCGAFSLVYAFLAKPKK